MIIKASQRGGSSQLANHLLNDLDNDHVTVERVDGFAATDFKGALAEAFAVSKGTRCKQFLFSVSVNPPKDADASIDKLVDAAERVGKAVGLDGQPHTIVVHEKDGRRHAHVVFSRIDPEKMTAINLPFFKNKLKELSKELYLENGWELPQGLRENGWKNPLNFTLAEWQQAKRLGLDPREIAQIFAAAYKHADGPKAFKAALEQHGYYLAKGDKRGVVATDLHGEVFAVARYAGVKTRDLEARFGKMEHSLRPLQDVKADIQAKTKSSLKDRMRERAEAQREAMRPLLEERARIVAVQRAERIKLNQGQEKRRIAETKERSAKMQNGWRGVWAMLTGQAKVIRQENDRDAYRCFMRDRGQREELFEAQRNERRAITVDILKLRREQRDERMQTSRQAATLLRLGRSPSAERARERDHERDEGRELSRTFRRTLK